jgi:hypothetical protein
MNGESGIKFRSHKHGTPSKDPRDAGASDPRVLAKTKRHMFPLGTGPHNDFGMTRQHNMFLKGFTHHARDKDQRQGEPSGSFKTQTVTPGFAGHPSRKAVQKKFKH